MIERSNRKITEGGGQGRHREKTKTIIERNRQRIEDTMQQRKKMKLRD